METKYSKTKFDGYTHRFVVQFEIGLPYSHNLQIYSNSDSYEQLENFINGKKSEKVISFEIVHRATKEQDDKSSEFIDEVLKSI